MASSSGLTYNLHMKNLSVVLRLRIQNTHLQDNVSAPTNIDVISPSINAEIEHAAFPAAEAAKKRSEDTKVSWKYKANDSTKFAVYNFNFQARNN